MELFIGQKRRVTIPLKLFEQSGLKEGDCANIYLEDGKLIITKETVKTQITSNVSSLPKAVKTEPGKSKADKNEGSSIIIKSNIEDLNKYVKSIVSECGLVVRSKRKYLNQFCEVCKGKLVENNENCNCIYKKNELKEKQEQQIQQKDIVTQIKTNTEKLKEKIDKNIKSFSTGNVCFKDDTVIEPISYGCKLQPCTNCSQYFTKGFLLNDDFYCKNCTKENFIEYMKYKKERGN